MSYSLSEIVQAARKLSQAGNKQEVMQCLSSQVVWRSAHVADLLTKAIRVELDARHLDVADSLLAVRAFLRDWAASHFQFPAAWQNRLPLSQVCSLNELVQPLETNQFNADHLQQQHLEKARQALSLLSRETEPIWWAIVQFVKGKTLREMAQKRPVVGLLEESIASLQASLSIWRELRLLGEWKDAITELDMAWVAYANLEPAKNIPPAIEFYEKTLPQVDQHDAAFEYALLSHSLGNLYCQRLQGSKAENVARAIGFYQMALNYRKHYLRADLKHWIISQIGLGNAYLEDVRGDRTENIQKAIDAYEAALADGHMADGSPPELANQFADACYNLAVAWRLQPLGDRAANIGKAIQYAMDGVKLRTREQNPLEWASFQRELGTLYGNHPGSAQQRADYLRQAIDYYENALQVYTENATPLEWAQVHSNLANVYCELPAGNRRDNFFQAQKHYQLALQVRTRAEYPLLWAETTQNLATVYETLGMVSQAAACYADATAVFEASLFYERARLSARNWANMHFAAQQWPEALQAFERAIQSAEAMYLGSYTPAGKNTELATNAGIYPAAAYAALRDGKFPRALEMLERGKTRLLADALGMEMINAHSLSVAERTRLDELKAHIRDLEGQLRVSAYRPSYQASERANAETLRLSYEELQQFKKTAAPTLTTSQILVSIPDATALVIPILTSQGGAVLVIPSKTEKLTQEHVVWLDGEGGRSPFNTQALQSLLTGRPGEPGWLEIPYKLGVPEQNEVINRVTAYLWDVLIGPVVTRLSEFKNICKVCLIPAGGLQVLPLHAAWRTMSDGTQRYFLDDYEVRYAPSVEIWQASQNRVRSHAVPLPSDGHIIVGVGAYTEYPELYYSCSEAVAVGKICHSDALINSQADRATLLKSRPKHNMAFYFHFAGHGWFISSTPLDSAICLAHDERLTLANILQEMDLHACRLVTLSACESGLADIAKIPDEFIGLPAGFIQAGAAGVVSSLWMVDDLSTTCLMVQFYENLVDKAHHPAQALRAAQQWLRKATGRQLHALLVQHHIEIRAKSINSIPADSDEKPYAQPSHWAGFSFYGD
jgi:CHAT domain-containing protein/tetratricopeptide (TPR) repeat protein